MPPHHVGDEAVHQVRHRRQRPPDVHHQDGPRLGAGVHHRVRPAVVEQHSLAFFPDIVLAIDDELGRVAHWHSHAEVIAQVAEIRSLVLGHRFAGFKDRDAFAQKLVEHLRKVQRQYLRLFEYTATRAEQLALSFPKDADDRETLNRLGAMGYRKPLEVSATVRRWLTGAYPSLRGEFARTQFTELVPVLLDRLGRAEHPDAALNAFDLFLGGLQRGARLFSLLKQNPDLLAGLEKAMRAAAQPAAPTQAEAAA